MASFGLNLRQDNNGGGGKTWSCEAPKLKHSLNILLQKALHYYTIVSQPQPPDFQTFLRPRISRPTH